MVEVLEQDLSPTIKHMVAEQPYVKRKSAVGLCTESHHSSEEVGRNATFFPIGRLLCAAKPDILTHGRESKTSKAISLYFAGVTANRLVTRKLKQYASKMQLC